MPPPRYTLLWIFVALSASICLIGRATAEILATLLPDGVPGYDDAPGVTIETRLHPEQMPLGLRDGPLIAQASIAQGIGYNSNALPGPYRRGSWQIGTAPTLALGTGWSHDAIGALVSIDDRRALSLPAQSRTDATISAGGRLDMGENQIAIAAAHIVQHEDRGSLDTIASDRPVAFQVDNLRAKVTLNDGRWSLIPGIEISRWTYDATTILGQPASQWYRDRIETQGSLTLRYEWLPLRDVVLVLRVLDQDYLDTPAGQISPNSIGFQVLTGVSDMSDPVWHWRVLLGGEARRFAAPAYKARDTLIAEAGATWSPDGMTTVGATISRETDAAAEEGISGLAYTTARLTLVHECLRDLLLKASFGWQDAEYFQGGYQSGPSFDLGLTWAVNRSLRVSLTYDQIDLRGSRFIGTTPLAGYSRGVGLLSMRMGL